MSLCPQCMESGERTCPVGEVWKKYKKEARRQSRTLRDKLIDKNPPSVHGRSTIDLMESALTQTIEEKRAELLAMALQNGCQIELKKIALRRSGTVKRVK